MDKHRGIPAASMTLLRDPEFSDRGRHPSAIAHGITVDVDFREIRDYVTLRVKSLTIRDMTIKTPEGTEDPDDFDKGEGGQPPTENDLTLEEIQSGEILRLGSGEEIQDMSTDFPCGHVEVIIITI